MGLFFSKPDFTVHILSSSILFFHSVSFHVSPYLPSSLTRWLCGSNKSMDNPDKSYVVQIVLFCSWENWGSERHCATEQRAVWTPAQRWSQLLCYLEPTGNRIVLHWINSACIIKSFLRTNDASTSTSSWASQSHHLCKADSATPLPLHHSCGCVFVSLLAS